MRFYVVVVVVGYRREGVRISGVWKGELEVRVWIFKVFCSFGL